MRIWDGSAVWKVEHFVDGFYDCFLSSCGGCHWAPFSTCFDEDRFGWRNVRKLDERHVVAWTVAVVHFAAVAFVVGVGGSCP